MSTSTYDPDEVIQVVINPALRPALEEWLKRYDAHLACIEKGSDEDLPTYIVALRGKL